MRGSLAPRPGRHFRHVGRDPDARPNGQPIDRPPDLLYARGHVRFRPARAGLGRASRRRGLRRPAGDLRPSTAGAPAGRARLHRPRAAALAFLDPAYRAAMDPLEVPGVAAAVERIRPGGRPAASAVLVWGDFDADGQTATALLVLALRRVGLDPAWYVPDRVAESHGLSEGVFAEVARHRRQAGRDLRLRGRRPGPIDGAGAGRGVDTIVTDHHPWAASPTGWPHPARALVTPRRLSTDHPATHLSGVGAAYVLAAALLASHGLAADDLLDLVALGTIADVAPLVGENRHLAQRGLPRLNGGRRLGIRALLEVAGRRPSASRDGDLAGWVLAPRLNAFGRLARRRPGRAAAADRGSGRGQAAGRRGERAQPASGSGSATRSSRWRGPGSSRALGADLPDLDEDGQPPPLPAGPNCLSREQPVPGRPELAPRHRRPGGQPAGRGATGGRSRWPRSAAASARVSMRSGAPWADLSRGIARDRGRGRRSASGAAGTGAPPAARSRPSGWRDLGRVFARAMAAQAPAEPLAQRLTRRRRAVAGRADARGLRRAGAAAPVRARQPARRRCWCAACARPSRRARSARAGATSS